MPDTQNHQLCQISDSGCQLLTETDTKIADPRRRRRRRRGGATLRKPRLRNHLREESGHKSQSIWGRNLDLEIEDPGKTLPWTDNSCQIALGRDTGIVCPSPLGIIGCETQVGPNLARLTQARLVTTDRTPDIEITTDSPSRRTGAALARQKFRWISCPRSTHDEQRRIEHAHV
jgi:hypothetical protein